jgi:hypothetical protein
LYFKVLDEPRSKARWAGMGKDKGAKGIKVAESIKGDSQRTKMAKVA